MRFEIPDRGRAEEITSDFRDHAHVRAADARGHCLIGALAAKAEVELFPEDGFARARKYIVERGEVHVGAAHNGNKGWLGHHQSFSSGSLFHAKAYEAKTLRTMNQRFAGRSASRRTNHGYQ